MLHGALWGMSVHTQKPQGTRNASQYRDGQLSPTEWQTGKFETFALAKQTLAHALWCSAPPFRSTRQGRGLTQSFTKCERRRCRQVE